MMNLALTLSIAVPLLLASAVYATGELGYSYATSRLCYSSNSN